MFRGTFSTATDGPQHEEVRQRCCRVSRASHTSTSDRVVSVTPIRVFADCGARLGGGEDDYDSDGVEVVVAKIRIIGCELKLRKWWRLKQELCCGAGRVVC